MKNFKLFLLSGLAVLTLAACGTTTTDDADSSAPETSSENRVFTLEELSQYDGKDGNPAYISVDGVVYDVSNVEPWANGEHKNGITAGNELSDEIMDSPHGKGVLDDLPVVGTLAEE